MENKAELIHGDCLIEMQNIPDKSVDLILCDLPYGATRNPLDKRIPFTPLWQEYNRIIKNNGAILLYCQGGFYIDLVNSNRKMFKYDLIWDKGLSTGFLNAKKQPLRKHEQIAVFYKKQPTYNPQFTEGKPLHSKGISYIEKDLVNQNYGKFNPTNDSRCGSTQKYPTSIISIKKTHPSKAKHRTEKPVELQEYFILTYSNIGDVILDNCMGSGNSGVAAIKNGRIYIGMEKDIIEFKKAEANIYAPH